MHTTVITTVISTVIKQKCELFCCLDAHNSAHKARLAPKLGWPSHYLFLCGLLAFLVPAAFRRRARCTFLKKIPTRKPSSLSWSKCTSKYPSVTTPLTPVISLVI